MISGSLCTMLSAFIPRILLRSRAPQFVTTQLLTRAAEEAGVLLTLDNLDLFDSGRVLRYWPVLLVVVGALMFREAGSRGLAVVLMVAGTLLVVHNGHWLRFSFAVLWPLLLIGIGLVIVLRAFGIVVPTAFVMSG